MSSEQETFALESIATEHGDHERRKYLSGIQSGFVDSRISADEHYRPALIANDVATGSSLLSVLKTQLTTCDSFDICVAFVAESGLQPLVEVLSELRRRGVRGRVLTSTYLNFNTPAVFKKLLEYQNLDVRVYQGNLHAKGYIFKQEDVSTVIIGSSNLTQMALTCNREWNVLFRSFDSGSMLRSVRVEFDSVWNDESSVALSSDWVDSYQEYRESHQVKVPRRPTFVADPANAHKTIGNIEPNAMQSQALEALGVLHARGERRALLISATGTGKTYLSAFDVLATKPKRVLFLAHRQRILEASQRSFERILGAAYTYGGYSPHGPEAPACMFAMCSTLVNHLDEFDSREFDYIVIDEAHRTGSGSYQRIIEHFSPRFMLGMTATPNRTDGYDVFALFNHVIAFKISLQDALANDMLAPFHYFGIADVSVNDEVLDSPDAFSLLTSDERVRHIISKIEEYSVDKENRHGLIFCTRNDEAAELSRRFNEQGYRTRALSGANSDAERNKAIADLESGELQYLFSVDIFNEGVDIPSVNQIIMLRKTESSIVFVQQLGRGLRKADGKDYALVLDFIGNYQSNFLVPVALSGDRTYNKDNLRAIVKEGSAVIPGCSTISFDRISEQLVYRAIDEGKFDATKLLREEYENLRQALGRIPALEEFDRNGAIDPLRIFAKYGSYHAFLQKNEKGYDITFNASQEGMLKFVSQKLASGKRLEDLLLLKFLVSPSAEVSASEKHLASSMRTEGFRVNDDALRSAVGHLTGAFAGGKGFVPLITVDDGIVSLSEELQRALRGDAEFARQLLEVVDFGISRHQANYSKTYQDTSFVLNAKYTYEEVCCLLRWSANVNGQNIGGYKYDAPTNTYPVFINYEKEDDISDTTKYEDRFESETRLIAISKSPRHLDSPEIMRLKAWPGNGMKTYLFMRKNKDDKTSKEFYFLGEMHPTGEFEEIVMPGTTSSAVEIAYELDIPVKHELYEYLTSGDVLGEIA